MMSAYEKHKKISEYEEFINSTLKHDLRDIEGTLQVKSQELKDWLEVRNLSKLLRKFEANTALDLTFYNRLFSQWHFEMFAKAEINEFNKVFVNIGCGCLLEMDLKEADKYATIRANALEKQIEHFRKMAVQVKVNIKIVLLAINELNPVLNSNFLNK